MFNKLSRRTLLQLGGAGFAAGVMPHIARAQSGKTIRAVMHAPLRVTDPVINSAWTGRNHALNIYDTLFSTDSKFTIRPQMVDTWEVSPDRLTYTFVLRPGLKFHDGAPVTSADVIPSLQRWAKRDTMGARMMLFVEQMQAVDARTFKIVLKSPYGLVLDTLAKPSSIMPFIMPARVASLPPEQPLTDFTGSGPFRFLASEFRPGSRAVYERNADYVSRDEPSDGLAGGKLVKIDRYEWISMPDMQTATNALMNGEVDFLETLPHDLIGNMTSASQITTADYNSLGFMSVCRINWLQEPFNNPDIRRAVLAVTDQNEWLDAQIGNPEYYTPTSSMFGANTPLATEAGWDRKPNVALAKDLLKKGSYKGQQVVLLQATDSPLLSGSSAVTAQKLRSIGMNVAVQTMDWGTLLARRTKQESVAQGGWSMTHWVTTTTELMNPVANTMLNARGKDGAIVGWPEDSELEKLRDGYALAGSADEQKKIATKVQQRAYDVVTHISGGQFRQPSAHSKKLTGVLTAPAPLFWNVEKAG